MQSVNWKIIFICIVAAMAGLVFGVDIGVIAQAKEFIRQDLHLNDAVVSWIVGSMMFGALFGSLSAGMITGKLGRKNSMILSAALFMAGCTGCTLTDNAAVLICNRIIVGFSIGVAAFASPLYLSEVAPKSIRGIMISGYQLMITVGILISYISNSIIQSMTCTPASTGPCSDFLIQDVSTGWRIMLLVTMIPTALFLTGLFLIPKSPRWLISKKRGDEALEILKKIRNSEKEAQEEAAEISATAGSSVSRGGWRMFLDNRNFRRTVFLGIALQAMQQLTGINVIMYYGPELIKNAGFTSDFAAAAGIITIAVCNLLATSVAIMFVEKLGRKPIMIWGYTVIAASMLAVAFFIHTGAGMAALAALMIFIFAFAFSSGPITWVLCSEIQPTAGRDFGITCSTCSAWIFNMSVSSSFLMIAGMIGTSASMCIYGILSVIAVAAVILFVPETRGVSLEHIEENLMKGVKLRDLGR